MLGPVETHLQSTLAATITDWPIREANGAFSDDIQTSEGGLPVDSNGKPIPFVEAEVIGGADGSAIGKPDGNLASRRFGLFRVYLCVGQGAGTGGLTTKVDALVTAFKRKTIFADDSVGQRLITMDPRPDDGVAGYQDASRFVRQVSIPWEFTYRI